MRKNDVAIIGISCVFPGSDNYEKYWNSLTAEKCSIVEIGKDRWDVNKFYSSEFNEKNKACTKWCGMIKDIYDFDNAVFHISRREAEAMDPQQRLLLQETWHCIEDSGVSFKKLEEQTTSVFVGAMNCDYRQELYSDDFAVDGYFTLGSFENMLANRISHCFAWNGSSTTLNAACASSLVAMDYAVNSLVSGNSDYAIAAASNLNVNPWKYISFSKARMLSPNGRCKTFDSKADGYVPGDGIAVLLLQKLDLAKEQGNKIYGVIKGVAVGHNGGAPTVTAPRIESQVKVISAAYKKAHLTPDEINYVETHGTGTSLGDPIEIAALEQVFKKQSKRKNKCYIGSVKTNIGHLESASGMAGVIKVLMMMKYHKIPITINTKGDNDIINFNDTHFILNTEIINWERIDGKPLRAGVSSFGFGGTNAHIILEEYVEQRKSALDRTNQMLVLSADSMEAASHIKNSWNENVDRYQLDDYSDLLKTELNEDRNQKYRYARVVPYGESPSIEPFASFHCTEKYQPKIVILDGVDKKQYAEYMALKNQYYRYSEIVDSLLQFTMKHKLKVELPAEIDTVNEDNYKVNAFLLEYGFAKFLREIGVLFHFVSWDKEGLFVMLALANIYKAEDIILYLAGKKSLQKSQKGLQEGILIHAQDGREIYPFDLCNITDNFNRFMTRPLSNADEILLQQYRKQYDGLFNNQYTYRNNILEWENSLKGSCRLSLQELLLGKEVWHKKYALITLYDSLSRVKNKWGIVMEEQIEDLEIRYFLEMVSNRILTMEEFLNMISIGSHFENMELERRARKYLIENGKFNVFTTCSEWREETLAEFSQMEYVKRQDELGSVFLSQLVTKFQENLVDIWLNGCDIRCDNLFQESSYQKKNAKRQYFMKNFFPKPGMKDDVQVYRPDDILIQAHIILERALIPGAEFICKMMQNHHLDSIDNILFMKAVLVDRKKEFCFQKEKNETYHVINLENGEEVFSCNRGNEDADEIANIEEEKIVKHDKKVVTDVYDALKKAGYCYGKSLQLINDWYESESYYRFQLKVGTETESIEILDNAFQCGIALAGMLYSEYAGITYLPYFVEHLEYNQELYGDVEVYIPKETYDVNRKIISTDILIVRGKEIVVRISHMILKASTAREESNLTYKMEWVDTDTKLVELAEHIVVLGDWSQEKQLLTKCCEGVEVSFIEKTQDFSKLSENIAEGTRIYWFCDRTPNKNEAPNVYYQENILPFLTFAVEISKIEKQVTVSLVCSGKTPYEAALKGIVKVLKRENSKIETGIYIVHDIKRNQINQLLHDSLNQEECEVSIGKQRKRKQLVPLEVKADGDGFIRENGVYIIIGGTGGIGREIAQLLADKKNANIILTGRNSKSSYIEEITSYVAQNAGNCIYFSADVCDKSKMQHMVEQVKKIFGHIDGIIHSAVELVDTELKNLNNDMFEQGLQCKYYGASILKDICIANDIKNILFFSSILTYTGNKGQASYIAGCNFLDEYAQYLNTTGLNAKVINWGYWAETGIAKNARFSSILKEWGIGKMKTSEGLNQFLSVMNSREVQIFIAKIVERETKNVAEEALHVHSKAQMKKNYVVKQADKEKTTDSVLLQEVIDDISQIVRKLTHNDEISIKTPFFEIGIESIIGVELVNEISGLYQIQLSQTIIFDYPTIKKMAEAIYQRYKEAVEAYYQQNESVNHVEDKNEEISGEELEEDIKKDGNEVAIIGISCRLGNTNNVEELWNVLTKGQNLVTEIPEDRWKIDGFYDTDRSNKQTSYCKWGSFIPGAYDFEPSFFKISPKEAKHMDPQQRVLMEESYKALEDAGYTYEMLDELKCGAFYGVMNNDYREILGSKTEYVDYGLLLSGNSNAILSARISYLLNLKGPALSLDTACSSSLVAMHMGCQAIQNGDADMMIIGGTTLFLSPEYYIQMCGLSMLSPRGMCSTFDQKADGFVPGEGVGVVILKNLDKALKDHDHIYGVLKGSGYSQDGATNGITAPSKESQRQLEVEVYRKSGINPETISMVEAHGTGTKLGDPIEVEALTRCYSEFTQRKNFCAIGSLKTYTGHTLAAAGVASVIKVLLCMKHKQLVPSLHYETKNEFIDFENSPFYLPEKVTDWNVMGSGKRRAAVSSFGFSGTNVHMIIEEPEEQKKQHVRLNSYLLPISAKTDFTLKKNIQQLIFWLNSYGTDDIMDDLQYTLIMRKNHFRSRCAVVVSNVETAIAELENLQQNLEKGRVNVEEVNLVRGDQINKVLKNQEDLSEKGWKEFCEACAAQYVNGNELDWTEYYKTKQNTCLPIPTYVFHKQECRAEFHLQGRIEEQKGMDSYEFNRDYKFLKDHMLGEEFVVPAAFIMKMAVEQYQLVEKERVNSIEEIFFDQRILFHETGVRVNLVDRKNHKQFTIEDRKHKNIWCRGKFINNVENKFSNRKIPELMGKTILGEEKCYQILDDLGLHYSNGFRCIKKVKIEGRYLTGKLYAKENLETYIIDGALQATALLVKELNVLTTSAIPISISKVQYLKPIEKESYIRVENFLCDIDSSFDIFILNYCGDVCVFMENVIIHTNRKEMDESKMLRLLENIYEGSKDIDDVIKNI